MSNSTLVTYTKISPNRTSPRNHDIDRITIHCYVGQVTAERGCNGSRFVNYDPDNGASCNYVVGYDGSKGLCVPESDRSWCSSNRDNDHRAITIEVACDSFHPYKVTDAAYNALLDLCTDICKRNGKKRLLWLEYEWKTLSYKPEKDEMVMTVHRWFANKACPGDYLYDMHGEIAAEVTRRLEDEEVTQEQFDAMMENYLNRRAKNPASEWATNPTEKYPDGIIGSAKSKGITDGTRPQSFATREEVAAMVNAVKE